MEKFINYGQKKGCSYVEVKSYDNFRSVVDITDNNIKELSSGENSLYGVRVIFKGAEGLTYSNKNDFKSMVDRAIKLARVQDSKIKFDTLKSTKARLKTKYKISLADVSLEEKKKDILGLIKLKKDYKKISSLKITYKDVKTLFKFYNSEGRDIEWNDCAIRCLAFSYAREGARLESFYHSMSGHKGYELFLDKKDKVVNYSLEMGEKMLKSKNAVGGNYPVMVDSHLGGVFAHEAVGHGCEADFVLQGNTVLSKLGMKVGTNNVTIVDDKTIEGNNGWVPYDDEGVEGERTVLINKGILSGYLHNRKTASEMKVKPTGNGRCMDASKRPIPRMSTTFVDKGDSSYDEILSSIKDGYYLIGTLGGQVNPTTGEFLFNAQHGYKVENGELKYLVKNVGLAGSILDVLHKINLVGKDLKNDSGGTCGKQGQWVPVSDGAPNFKIDLARVGGSS